jgi:hypothetical protein
MAYSFGIVVGAIASVIVIASALKERGYSIETPRLDQMIRNVPYLHKQESFHLY